MVLAGEAACKITEEGARNAMAIPGHLVFQTGRQTALRFPQTRV